MKRHGALLTALALTLPGCGGGSAAAPTPPARIQVGGQYATAVALTEDTCGGTAVMPLPTSVSHSPGETRLALTHGGTTYNGTLAADGSFQTDAVTLGGSAGSSQTVRIRGRFALQGFEADVDVDVVRSSSPTQCRYAVHWSGTKQGAPNVIP